MNRPENPSTLMAIPDVQSGSDERNLAIDQVGIRGLRYPLAFADGDAPAQSTIGTFAVMVALPEDRKGTHMSRLIEMLEDLTAPGAAPLSVPGMRALLDQLVVRLDAPAGRIEVAFPWFVRKTAPISGVASLLDYEVRLAAELQGDRYASLVTVAGALSVWLGDRPGWLKLQRWALGSAFGALAIWLAMTPRHPST